MTKSQKKHDPANDSINGKGQHLVSLWFDNDALSEFAVTELFKTGYEPNDIDIIAHQDLFKRPCKVIGRSVDSNKATVKKAVYGIKMGAFLGGVLSIIGTSIALLIQMIEPSLQLLMLIFVGALWGATLGFLIGLFFPLNASQYYERKLTDGNVLIQFWTKFSEKRKYFKHKNWTICQIGKPYTLRSENELI